MKKPPDTVSVVWCPECGRDNRHQPLRASHRPFADGARKGRGGYCVGKIVSVKYTLLLVDDPTLFDATGIPRNPRRATPVVDLDSDNLPEGAIRVVTTGGREFTGYFTGIAFDRRGEDWEFIDREWADTHPVDVVVGGDGDEPPEDKLFTVEPHEIASLTPVD